MAKVSQIDKAIVQLEGEIAVLQLAIQKLRDQQAAKPARKKPMVVKKAVVARDEQSA